MRRKDGSPIWVDLSGVVLSAAHGESLWVMLDITALKAQQEHTERIAFHDALTQLPNRLLLTDRLHQAIGLARRSGTSLAVCFIDLDGFKAVNDRHGHAAGDRLLRVVARRLQGRVRSHDTVARLGGDEFVLLLTRLQGRGECDAILQRVGPAVAEPVDLGDGQCAQLSASIGVTFCPDEGDAPQPLLQAADAAMYRVKQARRQRALQAA